jgi:transposase
MAISDGNGLPIAVAIESASPAECKLVEKTLEGEIVSIRNTMLIADKAYDSDGLDEELWRKFRIDLIAPHRKNRKRRRTQDGRKLRRYVRRWKVERGFAWLHNFRRIVTRWERKAENFLAFIHLGMMKVLLNGF